MYKPYADATLMRMTKADLIHQLRIAEGNWMSAEATIEQQYQNTKDWKPVVHGRWIDDDDGDGRHCSECGTDHCYLISSCEDYNYCPNCGAKMDEEGENDGCVD